MSIFYPWMTDRAKHVTNKLNLKIKDLPLEPPPTDPAKELSYNRRIYGQDHKPKVALKKLPADYEYEWDRVQRMRRQGHPLILGGNCIENRIDRGKLKFGFQNKPDEKHKTDYCHANHMNSIMHRD